MLSYAPETLALGQRLTDVSKRLDKLRLLASLSDEFLIHQKFPELRTYLDSQIVQTENEYLELIDHRRKDVHYEISVTEAASALLVAENTIRKWDVEGCPFDSSYPGRFSSVIFYQWARTCTCKKNFNREARKHAIAMNTSQISNSQK